MHRVLMAGIGMAMGWLAPAAAGPHVDAIHARGSIICGVNQGVAGFSALGLDERWRYNVIRAVGNYGESFERNLGSRSPIGLPRGMNDLWTRGGLTYALPLR
jgi:hypothetical protein